MTSLTFLGQRRWLGYFALVVVFVLACVALGNWQISRLDEARARIDIVHANYDAEPVFLTELVSSPAAFDPADEWRPVVLQGRYLPQQQLLVRNRPYGGSPGFEILVPLLLEDGSVMMVGRGWVPVGSDKLNPDAVPAPPQGEVTVTARLKRGEPGIPGRSAPEGQLASIELAEAAKGFSQPVYTGAYALLAQESPSAETGVLSPRPEADEGPHLGYALQWFVFGVMAVFGLLFFIRQEYRHRNADAPAELRRRDAEQRRRERRRPSDAEIEDALLDG